MTFTKMSARVSTKCNVIVRVKLPLNCVTESSCVFVIMKIITNLLKDTRDEWLVRTTATINTSNPIVDRIMDDDSVEGVIMTNREGAPILTNVSVTSATNYGRALHKFGMLSQMYVKEVNPLEEIMIIRIQTKKNEIMMAPDREFNIVVIQHARARHKVKDKKGKEK